MTDEGGATEYAYWDFGLLDYTDLLEAAMPVCGTYLIDLDNDLLYYFDSKTYEWLWRSHEGVEGHHGMRCVFMMSGPPTVIHDICSVTKWSGWSADLDNLRNMREATNRSLTYSLSCPVCLRPTSIGLLVRLMLPTLRPMKLVFIPRGA